MRHLGWFLKNFAVVSLMLIGSFVLVYIVVPGTVHLVFVILNFGR